MKVNIDFGFAEWSLLCGATLFLNSETALGISFLTIAVLSAVCRAGLRLQSLQQEVEDRKKAHRNINDAGAELAGAINELFLSPDRKKTVH